MIYDLIKGALLALMRCPIGPPDPPAGTPPSVQIFRASKNYLLFNLAGIAIVFFIFTLCFLIFALLMTQDQKVAEARFLIWLLPTGIALFGVLAFFLTRLEYDMRYYVVTDRSLRIREGVWTITEVTLTFANVQHLEIKQGPVQQMLGIADLVVRTAGGSAPASNEVTLSARRQGHRGVFRGIENASEIRDQINFLLKQYRHAGLGDPEERRKARPQVKSWNPQALELLKEIRGELRLWRKQP